MKTKFLITIPTFVTLRQVLKAARESKFTLIKDKKQYYSDKNTYLFYKRNRKSDILELTENIRNLDKRINEDNLMVKFWGEECDDNVS